MPRGLFFPAFFSVVQADQRTLKAPGREDQEDLSPSGAPEVRGAHAPTITGPFGPCSSQCSSAIRSTIWRTSSGSYSWDSKRDR